MCTRICVGTHTSYILDMYINMLSKDQGNKNQSTLREGIKMTEWVDSPGVFCFIFVVRLFTTEMKSCIT